MTGNILYIFIHTCRVKNPCQQLKRQPLICLLGISLSPPKMSAPQIPNLLTSRGGPRSRDGRGRGGRGRGSDRPGLAASAQLRRDLDIQSTDTDAAVSRLSAVSLGYLDDPFASYFVNGPGTRRLPIINRGATSSMFQPPSTNICPRKLHPDNCSRYINQRLPFSS